jgi:hypothetical protein
MTRRANAQVDELANLKKGSLYWKAFAMWMYGWLLIQRGAREVRAEPSGQGVVGIARPVGASQACTRQPGSESVTAVRHPSAVTARNEEVFYGGPSGSATRCNVQCERDGAVGSAGGNRGSDCALGSATPLPTSRFEWPSTDRVLLSYRSATTVSVNRLGSRRNNSLADTVAMPDQLPRAGQKTFCDLPSI